MPMVLSVLLITLYSIGIASELIECDERCGDVISYMLGRTIIFRDLDCATDYARASGYRVKIVTLDGQVINAGGSFTGGSNKRNSGMLTRAQEIQRFAEEAAALEVKLRAASDREKKIAEESAELRDRLGELKQNLSVLDTMLGAENTQNALLRSQIDADKESLIGQQEALEALGAESKRDDDECEALRRELSESETAAQRCREMLASTAEEHERLNRDIARALDRVSAQLIRINSAEKDIEATLLHKKICSSYHPFAAFRVQKKSVAYHQPSGCLSYIRSPVTASLFNLITSSTGFTISYCINFFNYFFKKYTFCIISTIFHIINRAVI